MATEVAVEREHHHPSPAAVRAPLDVLTGQTAADLFREAAVGADSVLAVVVPGGGSVVEDRLLTAAEVAGRLRVGRSMVYRLATDGILPSIRIQSAGSRRGAVRFFESDVEAYLTGLRARARGAVETSVDPDEVRRRVMRQGSR